MQQNDQITNFETAPDTGEDSIPMLRNWFESLNGAPATLRFKPGRYDFWPERAYEQYLFPSNNDEGLRRIAFPINGLSNITVDGQGAEFIFHGQITPFTVLGSTDIELKNFSIDWARPFHTEALIGTVGNIDENGRIAVELHIPEDYPYKVVQNQILFLDDTGGEHRVHQSLEFDPLLKETAHKVYDNYDHRHYHYAEELRPGVVRFTARFGTTPTPGNVLAMTHTGRDCPGVFIADSERITLRNSTIFHAAAMGVIAQKTRDVLLDHFDVRPAEHKNRIVSTTADATHFVNCAGLITIENCHFQGQLDDATNIHGIYAKVFSQPSDRVIEIQLVHTQQSGVHITHQGDRIEFVDGKSLQRYHVGTVKSATILNKNLSRIELEEPLPRNTIGDAVGSLTWIPDVVIKGCVAQKNRARGFLLSSGGKMLIENNRFHTPGCAIVVAGDASYWFESGAVSDLTIRNNHFDNCNYGVWGSAVIDIQPEIENSVRGAAPFHTGITIEGNRFDLLADPIVSAHSIGSFIFRNNVLLQSSEYQTTGAPKLLFDITHAHNVEVQPVETPLPALSTNN